MERQVLDMDPSPRERLQDRSPTSRLVGGGVGTVDNPPTPEGKSTRTGVRRALGPEETRGPRDPSVTESSRLCGEKVQRSETINGADQIWTSSPN